jgi:hypothetical protein
VHERLHEGVLHKVFGVALATRQAHGCPKQRVGVRHGLPMEEFFELSLSVLTFKHHAFTQVSGS